MAIGMCILCGVTGDLIEGKYYCSGHWPRCMWVLGIDELGGPNLNDVRCGALACGAFGVTQDGGKAWFCDKHLAELRRKYGPTESASREN